MRKQPLCNETAEAASMQQNSWFVSTYAPVGYSTKDVQTEQHQNQLLFTQHLLMGLLVAHGRAGLGLLCNCSSSYRALVQMQLILLTNYNT